MMNELGIITVFPNWDGAPSWSTWFISRYLEVNPIYCHFWKETACEKNGAEIALDRKQMFRGTYIGKKKAAKCLSRAETLECIIFSKVSNREEQLWNDILVKFGQKAGAEPHFTATQPSATQWNKSSLKFQFTLCFCAPTSKFRTSNLKLRRFLSLLYARNTHRHVTVTCLYSTMQYYKRTNLSSNPSKIKPSSHCSYPIPLYPVPPIPPHSIPTRNGSELSDYQGRLACPFFYRYPISSILCEDRSRTLGDKKFKKILNSIDLKEPARNVKVKFFAGFKVAVLI